METTIPQENKTTGIFLESLKRNAPKIRADRAEAIAEAAQILYKRAVEDLEIAIRQIERDRANALDMSPDNITSLKVAADFDAKSFVSKDIGYGIQLRNLKIELELSKERYAQLFGEEK